MKHIGWLSLAVVGCWMNAMAWTRTPPFTYQGRLLQNGQPYNGSGDFLFGLWDVPTGGSAIAGESMARVPVTDGLFTVVLNSEGLWDPTSFNGQPRWLEITVNGQTLAPRQPLTSTPYHYPVGFQAAGDPPSER